MVVVLVIFLKVFIIDVYALSAAPIMGEALVELFSGLLVGSGLYTAEEVNEMSWNDAETAINDGISSGTINPLQVVGDVTIDGVTKKMNFLEWLAENAKRAQAVNSVITSDTFGTITNVAVKNALSNYVPLTVGNWVNTLTQEDVVMTPATDMNGYGCKIIHTNSDGSYYVYYSEYAEIYENGRVNLFNDTIRELYSNKGVLVGTPVTSTNGMAFTDYDNCTYYGDVRTSDGTQAETDDTYTDEVGETADGEKVTLENIQSGAVSADDVALDYDKFNDEAIIDLLSQILATLENVPVVEEDSATVDSAKEAVSDMAAELDIAELNNLQMPLGIIDVFPFCLPFDFVRGMKLLSAKPETPYFEVNIVVPSFLGVPEQKWDFVIDFEMLEPVAKITRWTSLLAFSFVLIFLSTKIVKGAGS